MMHSNNIDVDSVSSISTLESSSFITFNNTVLLGNFLLLICFCSDSSRVSIADNVPVTDSTISEFFVCDAPLHTTGDSLLVVVHDDTDDK